MNILEAEMNKVSILIIVFIILISGCSLKNNSISSTNGNTSDTPMLSLNTSDVNLSDFSFRVSDFSIIKSENSESKDALNIYEKVKNTSVDSMKLGFDIGFKNSDAEVEKRDSYLILTIKFLVDDNVSQRDSIIPEMRIEAYDNVGDEVILIHNSMEDNYIQVDNPYGVFVFKLFNDTEFVNFKFDDTEYRLKLGE